MSIHVMSEVWAKSKLGSSELLCLLAIADFANDAGVAFPSIPTLAAKIRMSERATHYIINKLVQSGELTVERNAGPRGCNLFRVQTLQGCKDFRVQSGAEGGATDCSQGVQRIAPEPSVNHQEPSITDCAPKAKPKAKAKTKTREIPLPNGFCISERVLAWAAEKNHSNLEAHFEHFTGLAKAKGYTYVDWDEAFMGAVRMNWAKLNGSSQSGTAAIPVWERP